MSLDSSESNGDTISSWSTEFGSQKIGKKVRGTGNQKKNKNSTDHNTVKIRLKTQKNLENMRKFDFLDISFDMQHKLGRGHNKMCTWFVCCNNLTVSKRISEVELVPNRNT